MAISARFAVAASILLSLPFAAPASGRLVLDKGDAGSLNSFSPRVLPVLVRVDAAGRVKEVDPAYRLSPAFDRVLKNSIEELIQGPAVDRQGRRVASLFILNLVLETSLRDDGRYGASFRYASTQPVPTGRWGWEHIDGYRLALLDRSRTHPRRMDGVPTQPGPQYVSPASPTVPTISPSTLQTTVAPPAGKDG